MKKIILTALLLLPLLGISQVKEISLFEAIKLAQEQSPDYKANVNINQASYWRFKNYQAGFLPQLRMNATIPEFSNATRRITNDEGQDIFVTQNQSVISTNLSLSQNVPYTGGSLSIYSSLERVNTYGDFKSTGYSFIPFSISYYQNSLLFNEFKWDKKIEPLIYEEAKRDFIEKMEDISLETCRYYFDLLKSQMQLKIAKQNLSNQDTLYKIAEGRFKIGTIAENDLLQMELALLNSKNDVRINTIEVKRASQNLVRYLGLDSDSLNLSVPKTLKLFTIEINKALEEANSNRKAVVEFRRKRLEAEKELANARGNNRLNLRLSANFGRNQRGEVFEDLFGNYNKQESLSLAVGIPIFDWGVSKSKRRMAEANLDLVKTNIEVDKQLFEQEIFFLVLNWSNQRDLLTTAEKAQEVAMKRYDITQKRYVLGKVTITDLNLALQEKDVSVVKYLDALETFWETYLTIRKLTLYDFISDKKIEYRE
ncbi:MAG: TolC family protein [Flavobacteriaceae bacterium]|nr:TolC family protein [Flavobacteriaceae bacterium]